MGRYLTALVLLLSACGGGRLDLSQPVHLLPTESFWAGCYTQYDRDARQAAVQAGWEEWFATLPVEQRPRVIWGERGDSNNLKLAARDMHGDAAGTFHWDYDGTGVITFAIGAFGDYVAAHEIGHALLHGDDSDHVSCGDALDIMGDSMLCWVPVAAHNLRGVCDLHPELRCDL